MAETPTTTDRRPKTDAARERQRDGQFKGLLRAVAKRKSDNSADYATNLDHGQTASDLGRSAEAAGETRKEVRGHLSLVDRALLTLSGFFAQAASKLPRLPLPSNAAGPRAPKLVRAVALLLWRPLRLFRTQEHWEWLALCYRLRQLVRWRQKHGELTVERVEEFHERVDAIVGNYNREVDWRLKLIEKRFWKVWRLYRALVGVAGAVFGSRGSVFGFRGSDEGTQDSGPGTRDSELPIADLRFPIEGAKAEAQLPITNHQSQIASSDSTIENRQSAIETRQSLVQFRGTPHYEQFHPTWLERLDDLTAEAIANPFQSPSHTLRAQEKRAQAAAVKDPKLWQQRPPKPRLARQELPERVVTYVIRDPSERELRRMVRQGELMVPGSFEEFADLVEMALGPERRDSGEVARDPGLGTRDSGAEGRDLGVESANLGLKGGPEPSIENQNSKIENGKSPITNHQSKIANSESSIDNRQSTLALAESLWNRTHVFTVRVAELRELLEATLVWDPNRFLRLWLKLLPVEYGYDAVWSFQRTHGPHREDIAWGDPEAGEPRRKRGEGPRPAIEPRSEAEGRRKHAGELQRALHIWLVAVWHTLVPVMRESHKVIVALYDWAVSRFGIREEFLYWRPNLSLAQLETRQDRPEWAVRVVTATGKTLVKLKDGQVFEPEK